MKQTLHTLSAGGRWLTVLLACTLIIAGFSLRPANGSADKSAESLTRLSINLPAQAPLPSFSDTQANTSTPEIQWQEEKVGKGDSLARIFKRVGVSAATLHGIVNADKLGKKFTRLKPGQTVRFGYLEGDFQHLQVVTSKIDSLNAKLEADIWNIFEDSKEVETRLEHTHGTISSSLFAAGNKAGLSDNAIMQMADIFGWDIDFALDIRKGDSFSVVYETQYIDGEKIGTGKILAAEFINQGKAHQAAHFTDTDGNSDYYASNGRAMRKAFLRTPVEFSRISSRFTKRRWHPVLKKWRSHKGVDYAAPRGTPIRATSNGTIAHKGRKGGYGKAIFIQHGKKYKTVYGHLNSYAKGIRKGSKVKQGQIIGYVGSTGLATGPHLHYELRVNGVHRNPLTIKLPQARTLAKKYMPQFRDSTGPYFNRLALLNATQIAATNDNDSSVINN